MKLRKPFVMPQFGVVKGGSLDGWAFHFLRFTATPEGLEIRARCTPPAWPFPHDMALHPSQFMQLRAVPGARARRLNVDKLIVSAYTLESLPVPEWLLVDRMTLRAALKRSAIARRKRK